MTEPVDHTSLISELFAKIKELEAKIEHLFASTKHETVMTEGAETVAPNPSVPKAS